MQNITSDNIVQLGTSVRVQVREIQEKGSDVTHAVILAMWLKHAQ